jgi:hypothetical protein
MATLSSNSTDAEVWAAYDDNASYEEDASRAKALSFVTACRILRRRLPLSAGRGPQTVTREWLDAEISAAKAWLDAQRDELQRLPGRDRPGPPAVARDPVLDDGLVPPPNLRVGSPPVGRDRQWAPQGCPACRRTPRVPLCRCQVGVSLRSAGLVVGQATLAV